METAILKGNWLLTFDKSRNLIPPSINDSVRLEKISKRLKNKVNRPIRFEENGSMKTPNICFGCYATVGRMEALWTLKWSDNGEWAISESEDDVFLHYFKYKLKLIESGRKEYRFVVVEI